MGGSREGVSICMHAPIWIHESKITFTSRSIEPLLACQFTGLYPGWGWAKERETSTACQPSQLGGGCSPAKLRLTLCDPMVCRLPGSPHCLVAMGKTPPYLRRGQISALPASNQRLTGGKGWKIFPVSRDQVLLSYSLSCSPRALTPRPLSEGRGVSLLSQPRCGLKTSMAETRWAGYSSQASCALAPVYLSAPDAPPHLALAFQALGFQGLCWWWEGPDSAD